LVRLARGEPVDDVLVEDGGEIGPQLDAARLTIRAAAAWDAGEHALAVERMGEAVAVYHQFGGIDDDFPAYWSTFLDFAITSGNLERADEWLRLAADTPRGRQPRLMRALVPFFRARRNRDGDPHLVDSDLAEATEVLRAYGSPYWLARCVLEHAEFLIETNQVEASTQMLDEAEQLFTRLQATPWVERSRRARALAVR
jgi:hypothetical protein